MATICDVNQKPNIEYPIFWEYKVIVDNATQKAELIDEILAGENFKRTFSKHSSGGKYLSFNIAVFVNSENKRLEIFKRLKENFKFVL